MHAAKSLNIAPTVMNLELETIKKCSAELALALKGIEGDFLFFLNREGFITDDVLSKILNPVTVITAAQKADELVMLIRDRVAMSPDESFRKLITELERRGKRCEHIVTTLRTEHAKQMGKGKKCDRGIKK